MRQLEFERPEHTGQALVHGVTDDTRDFLSFGDNAIRTQTVLHSALSSYHGGRKQGYWTRMDTWPGRPREWMKVDVQENVYAGY